MERSWLLLVLLGTLLVASVAERGRPKDYLSLPQYDKDPVSRGLERALNQRLYLFIDRDGLSPTLNGTAGYILRRSEYAEQGILVALASQNTLSLAALTLLNMPKIETVEDVVKLYDKYNPKPLGLTNWQSDEAFAAERLTCFPLKIEKALQLPFNLQDSQVQGLLRPGKTLQQELTEGRLYVEDYSFLNGLDQEEGRIAPDAIALYYVKGEEPNKMLIPLAIKPETTNNRIVTPNDPKYDWMLAKMFVNCATFFYHAEIHFLNNHIALEPIAASVYRMLSRYHPIRPLLLHHFHFIFSNTILGFELLFSPNTTFDNGIAARGPQYVQKAYPDWNLPDHFLEADIAKRGIGDLPNFRYYKYSAQVKGVIRTFVARYLGKYYKTDADVVNDIEVQSLLSDCIGAGRVSGMPTSLSSRNTLYDLVTHLIWLVAVQHHAVNSFVAYHYVTVVPMHPPHLNLHYPTAVGTVTGSNIFDYIGTPSELLSWLGLGHAFLRPLPRDEVLGPSMDGVLLGPNTRPLAQYQLALEKLSADIEALEKLETVLPFPFLSPNNLPYHVFI